MRWQWLLNKMISTGPTPNAEDVCRLDFRIKLDVIAATAPNVTRVAQEIVHLISVAFHGTELIDWYIDI